MLEFSTEKKQLIYQIELSGALNSQTSSDFKKFCDDILEQGYQYLVYNCENLDYVSSAGIASLLYTGKRIKERLGAGFLCGANEEVLSILNFLGVRDFYEIKMSVRDALAEIKTRTAATAPATESQEPVGELSAGESDLFEDEDKPALDMPAAPEADSAPAKDDRQTTPPLASKTVAQDTPGGLWEEEAFGEPRGPSDLPELDDEFIADDDLKSEIPLENVPSRLQERTEHPEKGSVDEGFVMVSSETEVHNKAMVEERFQDFYIKCANCGTLLKINTYGKHYCPDCKKQFFVDENKNYQF